MLVKKFITLRSEEGGGRKKEVRTSSDFWKFIDSQSATENFSPIRLFCLEIRTRETHKQIKKSIITKTFAWNYKNILFLVQIKNESVYFTLKK